MGSENYELIFDDSACGVVILALAGASLARRHEVGAVFHQAGLGTLALEYHSTEVAERGQEILNAIRWLRANRAVDQDKAVGLLGEGEGVKAIFWAASQSDARLSAIACLDGQVDLSETSLTVLRRVEAPTLLLVGEENRLLVDLSEATRAQLRTQRSTLEVIPGASEIGRDSIALEAATYLASDWFRAWFTHASHVALRRIQAAL